MRRSTPLLTACLLLAPAGLGAGEETQAARPNIIVVFSDDHGWADLGAQGVYDDLRTPNLDALAAGGVRAASGYVTAPQCVPSRAGLLAGRYQPRFGVESNGDALDGFNEQLTIAERLKKAGYATGMTGKWHLGPSPEIPSHGFDDVYQKSANRPGWANFDLEGNRREGGQEHSPLYHIDANSEAACAFIRRHHDRPFFFYCAYRAPHVPLDAPEKYLARFPGKMPERRRQALAMISAIDDGVGRIISTLREFDLEQRTLIFFIGDNGAPLKIHKLDAPGGGAGWDGSLNDPLNGEKGMLTEGGIRVPFVMHWKGRIPGGQVYDHPVISLDVAATALSLAGLPHDAALDGVNLIPHLTGENKAAPHDVLYWRWIAQSAIREGKWKLLVGGPRQYLFDLEADPEEKDNLAEARPEIARRLRARLEEWGAELKPPGIHTKPMAQTWEDYFDFYLDGKPAPPQGAQSPVDKQGGWVARNCVAEVADGMLRVTPDKTGRQKPFIACAGLKVPGPATARLEIRSAAGGRVGFAWRIDGQKDFPPEQTMYLDLPASDEWQAPAMELPAAGAIIHVRLLLPAGVTEIRRIDLAGRRSDAREQWEFNTAAPEAE